jgi:hypothetical protein
MMTPLMKVPCPTQPYINVRKGLDGFHFDAGDEKREPPKNKKVGLSAHSLIPASTCQKYTMNHGEGASLKWG